MRIFFDIGVLLAVLYAPFWFMVVLCAIGLYVYTKWFEFILATAIYQLLFHATLPEYMTRAEAILPLTFYALLIFVTIEWLRKYIRERTT